MTMIGLRELASNLARMQGWTNGSRTSPRASWDIGSPLLSFSKSSVPESIAVSPLESIGRCVVLESGILPSAFHFVSIKLVCCLSCCPLRCGPQERNCVPDGATTSRWYIGVARVPAENAGARGKTCLVLSSQVSGQPVIGCLPRGLSPARD